MQNPVNPTVAVGSVSNSDLRSIRVLGGIAAVLGLLSVVLSLLPIFGFLLFLVAIVIHLFVGLKLSKLYNSDKAVFRVSIALCCEVAAGLVLFTLIDRLLNVSSVEELEKLVEEFLGRILLAGLLVIVGAVFFMLYLRELGAKLGNSKFETGAILFIIGFFLRVIFIGYVVEAIAYIFILIAFLSVGSDNAIYQNSGIQYVQVSSDASYSSVV
ncbi:hypothetical protein P9112_003525 [Eukaryota sp. TZLM1-RC]